MIASSSSCLPKGFVKNSTAPAFIARTLIGISPCPVRKTMGISMPDFASSACRSRPLRPGSSTSRIKHAGTSGRWPWTNSVADPNVRTVKPAEFSKSATDSRTSGSSSTTNTMHSGALMRLAGGQGEMEHSPTWLVRYGPEPAAVRLDDRAADRQSHSDTLRLGGEKGSKQLRRLLRVDSRPGIGDGHQKLASLRERRIESSAAWVGLRQPPLLPCR